MHQKSGGGEDDRTEALGRKRAAPRIINKYLGSRDGSLDHG